MAPLPSHRHTERVCVYREGGEPGLGWLRPVSRHGKRSCSPCPCAPHTPGSVTAQPRPVHPSQSRGRGARSRPSPQGRPGERLAFSPGVSRGRLGSPPAAASPPSPLSPAACLLLRRRRFVSLGVVRCRRGGAPNGGGSGALRERRGCGCQRCPVGAGAPCQA